MKKMLLGLVIVMCSTAAAEVSFYRVDSLERVFADLPAQPLYDLVPPCVPRGAKVPLQFFIDSSEDAVAKIAVSTLKNEDGQEFKGLVEIYKVLPVHVEANSNSGGTKVGKASQGPYNVYILREAPFDPLEVLVKGGTLQLKKGRNAAVVLDVTVDSECSVGVFAGKVTATVNNETIEVPFSVKVYQTVLPKDYALKTTHWLTIDPQNLTNEDVPEYWSDEYWELIKNTGKMLYDFGDRTVTTPTIYGEQAMIQTILKADGSYGFDFSRFDRWVTAFLDIGYEQIESVAFCGHWIYVPEDIYALNEKTGEMETVFKKGFGKEKLGKFKDKYEWPEYRDRYADSDEYKESKKKIGAFLTVFFDELYGHLKEKGWTEVYAQQLLDEPRTVEDYAYLSDLAREHMPGIKISNAIHGWGVEDYEKFSQYLDTWTMEMQILEKPKSRAIIADRKSKGQRTGAYVLGKATKWPNRLLDRPLFDNRLQPWMLYLYNADCYLHWAANQYRGADPYKSSIGPVPGGSQDPGHPAGNNWIFYPGPDGLLPSVRAIAFRDGLIDYTLLKMLAEKDEARADEIVRGIIRSTGNYQMDKKSYHIARKSILDALESIIEIQVDTMD